MPQIDKVAYFAQVLWVFGLFVAFYAIISVEVLSGISTVYSVRKHIKSQCTKYGSELSQENVDMEFNYNSLIKHSCAESKKVLNKSVLACQTWAKDASQEVTTSSGMADVNNKLIVASQDLAAQRYIFNDCLNGSSK